MNTIFKGLLGLTLLALLTQGVIGAQTTGTTNQPTAAELKPLQGTWEGVLLGQESAGKITITITSNLLHFQGREKSDWYDATFTLPPATHPQELRATITGSEQTNHIGSVVRAIFKIEGETLTLAGIQDNDQEPPKTFNEPKPVVKPPNGTLNLSGNALGGLGTTKPFEDDTVFRYKLQKLPPQKKPPTAASVK